MTQKIYQVDAFTSELFGGNSAAVCPLDNWLSDDLMQKIARENNLAETAFYVPMISGYHIRWFTPKTEVALCGHATLATAYVIFEIEKLPQNEIKFDSLSGELGVKKSGNFLTLDFPSDTITHVKLPINLAEAMGKVPLEIWRGKTDYLLIYKNESDILDLNPDLKLLAKFTEVRAVIASAKGDKVDFVSRVFAPQSGIDEDPVTGSAHTTLTPYWAGILKNNTLKAQQLSERKGDLFCELKGKRVAISGKARLYLQGKIWLV